MFGSFLPSPLVGLAATKVYSGMGADIVMESILRQLTAVVRIDKTNGPITVEVNRPSQASPEHLVYYGIVRRRTTSCAATFTGEASTIRSL